MNLSGPPRRASLLNLASAQNVKSFEAGPLESGVSTALKIIRGEALENLYAELSCGSYRLWIANTDQY